MDVSGWSANNLHMEASDATAPTPGARVVRLIEDAQNVWRNIQTKIQVEPDRPIKISAEIKFDTPNREVILMALTAKDRFACYLNPATGRIADRALGRAIVWECTATTVGDGWWRLMLTGSLPTRSPNQETYLSIAITTKGFDEDYQGDGKSGISVGGLTLAQQSK
jgi:hypothetical protein